MPGFVELAQSRELRAGDRAALLAAVAEVTRRRQVTLTLILTLTLISLTLTQPEPEPEPEPLTCLRRILLSYARRLACTLPVRPSCCAAASLDATQYLYAGWGACPQSQQTAFGGLAGGFEAAGGAAQDQPGRPGPWLWQGGQWGAAAAEGGRHLNLLEGT